MDRFCSCPSPSSGIQNIKIDSFLCMILLNVIFYFINFAFLISLKLLIWVIIPSLSGSAMANTKNVLRFFIILQYVPRLYLIFPLSSQIVEATGVVTETAWAGAAYNLMLYMLASHVSRKLLINNVRIQTKMVFFFLFYNVEFFYRL